MLRGYGRECIKGLAYVPCFGLQQRRTYPFCLRSGLVNHCASINNVDGLTRQLRVLCERKKPEHDDTGLSETCRQITCCGEVAGDEALVQCTLPRKRRERKSVV